MRISMSTETYELIADDFIVEDRGASVVKGFDEAALFYSGREKESAMIKREFHLKHNRKK